VTDHITLLWPNVVGGLKVVYRIEPRALARSAKSENCNFSNWIWAQTKILASSSSLFCFYERGPLFGLSLGIGIGIGVDVGIGVGLGGSPNFRRCRKSSDGFWIQRQ